MRGDHEWLTRIERLAAGDACEFHYPARNKWLPGVVVRNGGHGTWEVRDESDAEGRRGESVKCIYIEHVRCPRQTEAWLIGFNPKMWIQRIAKMSRVEAVDFVYDSLDKLLLHPAGRIAEVRAALDELGDHVETMPMPVLLSVLTVTKPWSESESMKEARDYLRQKIGERAERAGLIPDALLHGL